MDIIFKKLVDARHALGHTIQAACDAMGLSRAAWYAWEKAARKAGGTFRCHPLTERAVAKYLGRAGLVPYQVERRTNETEKAGE